jgi:DNA polymerase I-like protein with 3'-5' exonuclease and polymerase domains
MSLSFYEMGTDAQRPKAEKRPWMEEKEMSLVTEETLAAVIDECIAAGRYSLDLETTGLDKRVFDGRTKDQIVGVCLSPDGVKGYYAPMRHKKGAEHNISVSKMERELRRLVNSDAVAIFHNAKFDQEFLQFAGGEPIGLWDDPKKWEDTLILAWLRNTRERRKGLKYLSKTELGYEMIEIKELFPPDYKGDLDFSLLDPSEEAVVLYGASDAICTYGLFDILHPQVVAPSGNKNKGQAIIYHLEKMTVAATRWMERCRVMIDQKKVAELMQLGQQEYFDCMAEVYDFCNEALGRNVEPGWFQVFRKKFNAADVDHNINEQIHECRLEAKREMLDALDMKGKFIKVETELKSGDKKQFPEKYDILSRPQLGPLFEELEIPDLKRTEKSGQVQTTQSEIERLNDRYGSKYPFLPKVKRLGELQKALGTYLISLRNDVGPDGTLLINYNQLGTDTGRFTTPSSRDPQQDGGTKYPMHGTPATYDKSRPQCLLRIREAIVARPGKLLAAIDFGGVELRIATNLSGEPKWMKEFFRCSTCGQEFDTGNGEATPQAPPSYCPRCGDDRIGDLHTLTGVAFFGEAHVGTKQWKMMRGMAKSSNFALAYGGGPNALVRSTGCSETDAARHHRTFNSTYTTLKGWWDSVKAFGRLNGYVTTRMGRQYPIPDIQLPVSHKECPDSQQRMLNKKFRAKAERNATNGPIQGTSADLTKLAMALCYREVKKRGWFEKVLMTITIHDELVFEIDKDIAVEALETFQNIMTRNKTVLAFKWPVPLTTDCEIGSDWTVPYDTKDFKFRRVRRDGMQVDEKGRDTGKVWPADYVRLFGAKYGYADDAEAPPETPSETPESPEATAPAPEAPPVAQEPSQAAREALGKSGETFEFHLRSWGVGTAEKLAHVIVKCRGRGTHPLKVVSPTGESALWDTASIMVNPIEFETVAKIHGL